jgi:transcriptional regulator with XRE-family HTH domain
MGRNHAGACYRELGAALKKRREAAGLAGDDIGRVTGWHRSKVSRVEHGQVEISVVDAIHYLAACKVFVTDAKEILTLCGNAERHLDYWVGAGGLLEDSFSSLIYHEATADRSIGYEPMFVPGLLQTEGYSRALMEQIPDLSGHEVDAAVRTRGERQGILRRLQPAQFTFYVHEQALRVEVGSRRVMHEQLLKLVLMAALPNVKLRVLPTLAGEKGLFGGSFQLFEFHEHHPLVYFSSACNGVFLEDQDFVTDYRRLLPGMASVALDERESRALIADLANALDQRSQRRAPIYELEEEQL